MTAEDAYNTLKTFLETHPACQKAISPLRKGVEIGILVGGTLDCAIYQDQGQVKVEQRPANNPDVVFTIAPDAVYIISNNAGEDVGDLAVAILKEIASGTVKIKVPGNFINIVRNGYLEIIKSGGAKLWQFLATKGITNIAKVTSLIKNLKKG